MAHIKDHVGTKEFSEVYYLFFKFIGKIYLKAKRLHFSNLQFLFASYSLSFSLRYFHFSCVAVSYFHSLIVAEHVLFPY